jgi:hypothetical protein
MRQKRMVVKEFELRGDYDRKKPPAFACTCTKAANGVLHYRIEVVGRNIVPTSVILLTTAKP